MGGIGLLYFVVLLAMGCFGPSVAGALIKQGIPIPVVVFFGLLILVLVAWSCAQWLVNGKFF